MKTLSSFFTAFLIAISAMTSCNEVETSCMNQLMDETTPTENVLQIKYQGNLYNIKYTMQNDTTKVFNNPKIEELVERLNNGNYSNITHENGLVEYFDTTKELEKCIQNLLNESKIQTRISGGTPRFTKCTLIVYENNNYGGKSLTYTNNVSVPDMRNALNARPPMLFTNFDDMISSFKFSGTVSNTFPNNNNYGKAIVTFYKDLNYTSTAKSYVITPINKSASVSNFKDIKFDNTTTSLKVVLSNY